jgi:hypothetical protein
MEELTLETETLSSDIHFRLGLKESKKKNPETPLVLSLVSSVLERSVLKNEMLLEKEQKKEYITIFHGTKAPALGIRQYIDRIFKYSCCSPSCFVVANIYVDKFVQVNNVKLTSLNVHRLFITAVMIAAKFVDDAFFNNAYYARVGGISTSELNKLEMKFLFGLNFRLQVSIQTFNNYCLLLEKEASGIIPIERMMISCAIKQSWANNEDSTFAPTIAR